MIEIKKLALKLNGISEHEGMVLAWKIREVLGQARVGKGQNLRVDSMKIDVERQEGEGMDVLGRRIVANVLSQIEKAG